MYLGIQEALVRQVNDIQELMGNGFDHRGVSVRSDHSHFMFRQMYNTPFS